MTRFLSLHRLWLLAALLLVGVASALHAQTITTFDVPNSTYTIPTAINLRGQITGHYVGADGSGGFLRKLDGTFATFSIDGGDFAPPNAYPMDINAAGQIVGYYFYFFGEGNGFLRQPNGTIIAIRAGASTPSAATDQEPPPFSSPICPTAGSAAAAINDLGQITGEYYAFNGCGGYLRQRNGTITHFDVSQSGPPNTLPQAINLFGQITGYYRDANATSLLDVRGFLRQPNGTVITFDPPDSGGTTPKAINLFAQITGYYRDANSLVVHGFLRQPNGTIITFDPPGSSHTEAQSINLFGQITGFYVGADGIYHGFLREQNGAIATFDVPNSQGTFAQSINLHGRITGSYFDGSSYHGFVRSPR